MFNNKLKLDNKVKEIQSKEKTHIHINLDLVNKNWLILNLLSSNYSFIKISQPGQLVKNLCPADQTRQAGHFIHLADS